MASVAGLLVEFKAKQDSVDAAFRSVESQSNKVIAKNKQMTDSFAHTLNTTTIGIAKLASGLAVLGIAVGLGIGKAAASIGEGIDKITDKARGLDISGESLQRLGYAASQAGTSIEELTGGLTRSNVAVGRFFNGDTELVKTFSQLKLSVADLASSNPDQQLLLIGEALLKITDANKQADAASRIFGRNYVPILGAIKDGLGKNIVEFDKLGLGINESQRIAIHAFGDVQTKASAVFGALGGKITAAVSPALTKIIDQLIEMLDKFGGIDAVAKTIGDSIAGGFEKASNGIQYFIGQLQEIEDFKKRRALQFAEEDLASAKTKQTVVNQLNAGQDNGYGKPFNFGNSNSYGQSNLQAERGVSEAQSKVSAAYNALYPQEVPGIAAAFKKVAEEGSNLKSILPSIGEAFEMNRQAVVKSTEDFKKMSTAFESAALSRGADVSKQYQDYATARYVPGATASRFVSNDVGGREVQGSIPNEIGGGLNQKFADSLRSSFEKAQDGITKTQIKILEDSSKQYPDIVPLLEQIKQEVDPGALLQEIKLSNDLLETLKKNDLGKAAKIDLDVKISVAEGFIVSSTGKGDINKLVYNAVQDAFVDAAGRTGFRGIR